MASFFSGIIATLVTLPLLVYLIIFIGVKQVTGNHRMSVRAGIDVTAFFCMFSVHFLVLSIWGISLLWLILLIAIIVAMAVVIVHHRMKGDIKIKGVWKGFCRLNGLIFIPVHCLLVVYGLAASMFKVL